MLQHSLAELEQYFALRHAMSGAGALGETAPANEAPSVQARIEVLEEDRLVLRREATPEDLRPGRIWSGPALTTIIDSAGYLMTVAHLPPGSDAVTVDMTVKFLRPAPFDALVADAHLLHLTPRRTVVTVALSSPQVPDGPVAHATLTFAARPAEV